MSSSKKSVRIVAQQATTSLSKGQKAFNTLVAKIAKQRDVLAQWQVAAEACKTKVASELLPLQREFQAQQGVFVRAMDQMLDKPGLTKTERETMSEVILSIVESLIVETDDASLKPLYTKYSGTDFDAEEEAAIAQEQAEGAQFKAAMEAIFGAPSGENPDAELPQTPEELMQKLYAHIGKQSPGKPTAKQRAKAEQQKAEDDKTSLSIREVYRKLTSAVHPDREPDLAERERKTALMQRVNQAYDKKDLLKLLELQLELEHIDSSTIASLSEDRLTHYNKVLKEQLRELEAEVVSVQMPLRAGFQMHPYEALTLPSVIPRIHAEVAQMKRNVAQVREQAAMLDDPKALKGWIKEYRRELKAMRRAMDAEDPEFMF